MEICVDSLRFLLSLLGGIFLAGSDFPALPGWSCGTHTAQAPAPHLPWLQEEPCRLLLIISTLCPNQTFSATCSHLAQIVAWKREQAQNSDGDLSSSCPF